MVAAAKLRRAQGALMQARPYGVALSSTLERIAGQLEENASPFLRPAAPNSNAEIRVFTSDRGLCGGFNSNLLRRVYGFLNQEKDHHAQLDVVSIGKKGRDFFKARKVELKEEITGLSDQYTFAKALEDAEALLKRYADQEFDSLYLAYNGFKSAISQEIQIRRILPLQFAEIDAEEKWFPVIYEPSPLELFHELLPRFIASQLYLAHLESNASELGARMSAMENATNNAKEMIGILTLQYNRARQAAITKELMDIVNGAESLK